MRRSVYAAKRCNRTTNDSHRNEQIGTMPVIDLKREKARCANTGPASQVNSRNGMEPAMRERWVLLVGKYSQSGLVVKLAYQ